MSTVSVGKAQIGQSGTAANNFTFRTLNDGSLRISRGNADGVIEDVLVIDANGNFSEAPVLGVGQTWQNLTGSRVIGTTYTNTTGRPIAISVSTANGNSQNLSITVAGVVVFLNSSGSAASVGGVGFAVVPAGSTYSVTSNTALTNWAELR